MVSTIFGGFEKWWCRVHRSCTELQQILQTSMSLCGPRLSKWALKTVTFPDLNDEFKWANKVGVWAPTRIAEILPLSIPTPQKKTTTSSSFHINMERFEWKSQKTSWSAPVFPKNNDPPAPGHLGGSKPPCFSPTVFDAGRVAIRIPMPLRLAVPAEPQAAKRLKTDQKSVPLARFVVFSCWVFWR